MHALTAAIFGLPAAPGRLDTRLRSVQNRHDSNWGVHDIASRADAERPRAAA